MPGRSTFPGRCGKMWKNLTTMCQFDGLAARATRENPGEIAGSRVAACWHCGEGVCAAIAADASSRIRLLTSQPETPNRPRN